MRNYFEMTRAEADDYLAVFLTEMPASRRRLADTLAQHGADPGLADEFTPASLDPIWNALTPLFAWQDLYLPPDPMTQPSAVAPLEGLGDLTELPSWFTDKGGYGLEHFSPRTLWLIDGIARHLGNVLVEHDNFAWAVGHGPQRGNAHYAYQNQPIVLGKGHGNDWSTLMSSAVLISRELDGRSLSDAPLKDMYEAWLAPPPVF